MHGVLFLGFEKFHYCHYFPNGLRNLSPQRIGLLCLCFLYDVCLFIYISLQDQKMFCIYKYMYKRKKQYLFDYAYTYAYEHTCSFQRLMLEDRKQTSINAKHLRKLQKEEKNRRHVKRKTKEIKDLFHA